MKQMKITENELKKFKKILTDQEKSQNTINKYMRDVRKLMLYADGRQMTKTLMISYKSHLEKSGLYKASSINSFLTAANHFCNAMGWKEFCVHTVKVQRTTFESEEKELTEKEYRRLVHAALAQGDERTALIMQTLAGTGIRIGELQYITVECLEKGMVDVVNKGKVRRILLPSKLQIILKNYVSKHEITEGAVFCRKDHRAMDRRTIWRHLKKTAQAAGVSAQKVYPHNFRHLFAREFYRQTKDIAKLADVLGHSSIETTRIYIKSTGREHKEQLNRMNMIVSEERQTIEMACDRRREKTMDNRQKQHKASKILLPQDTSLLHELQASMTYNEKIKSIEKLFSIIVDPRSEYEKVHNKYYVASYAKHWKYVCLRGV